MWGFSHRSMETHRDIDRKNRYQREWLHSSLSSIYQEKIKDECRCSQPLICTCKQQLCSFFSSAMLRIRTISFFRPLKFSSIKATSENAADRCCSSLVEFRNKEVFPKVLDLLSLMRLSDGGNQWDCSLFGKKERNRVWMSGKKRRFIHERKIIDQYKNLREIFKWGEREKWRTETTSEVFCQLITRMDVVSLCWRIS